MSPFSPDLRRLYAEGDRLAKETDELLARLELQKRVRVRKDMATSAGKIRYKKVANAKTRGLDFVLSDSTPDRYDDIVMSSGWMLENFNRNPIALFQHQTSFPIGTWKNVRVEDNALRGTLQLAPRDSSDRIAELHSLLENDVLRAVSVGFQPIEYEERKGDTYGIVYTKQELVECSLVSVPANPNALQVAKKLNISDETRNLVFARHAADESERPHRLPALAGPMTPESDRAWNSWADDKVHRAINKALVGYTNEVLFDVFSKKLSDEMNVILADEREAMRKEVRQEIANLRKDLTIEELNREVARLKRGQKR